MENGPSSSDPSQQGGGGPGPTLELEVAKPESGEFGFLVSYVAVLEDHVISVVDPNSAAEAGGLQVSDVILEVNGKSVHGKDAGQLRTLVLEREDGVRFKVLRDGINRLPRECRLFKHSGFQGFGFDLHAQPGVTGHFVSHLESGSPAERAGLLASDIILKINNVPIENKTHKQVVKMIKKSPNAMELLVVYSGKTFDSARTPRENGSSRRAPPPGSRLCILERDSPEDELGFDLYAKKGEVGHYITQVAPGSRAEAAGLRSGDKILEINKVEANHDSHREVIQRIKSGGTHLEFLVVNEDRDFSAVYREANGGLPEEDPVPASSTSPRDVNGPSDLNGASKVTSIDINGDGEGAHLRQNGNGMPEESPVYSKVVRQPRPLSTEGRVCHIVSSPGEPLGFELSGNKKRNDNCVSDVDAGSPAERAGLKPGDRLLEINGVKVANESYTRVVEMIKRGGAVGDVRLLVQGTTPGSSRRSCRLVKEPGHPELGLDVTSSPTKGDHRVTTVTVDSVAEAAGLKVGDLILEVNGQDVQQMSHTELIDLVMTSGPDLEFLVQRDGETMKVSEETSRYAEVSEVSPGQVAAAPVQLDRDRIRCRLVKSSPSLGLDLHTVIRDQNPVGHYVVEVDPGSPAENAGLRRGHRLLEVDGQNVEKATHDQVVDFIQGAPREVDIVAVMTNVDLSNLPSNQPPESSPKPQPSIIPVASTEDGQRAWLASGLTKKPLGLDLVQASLNHLDWLKEVADTVCLHESRGAVLSRACRRYLHLWLPMAAKHPGRPWPAPPDVEWMWHCHLLSPRAYRRDCQFLVGQVVDHAVLSRQERERGLEGSRALWQEEYPSEPFDMDAFDTRVAPATSESAALTSELLSAALRQAHFYYQVSLPHFRNVKFLEEAVQRYRKFLFLRRQAAGQGTLGLSPCQDMDLVWRTHQLHPLAYFDVMSDIVGSQHALDFQTEATTTKAGQKAAFEKTRQLWQSTFGEDPGRFGALFRGEQVEGKLRPLGSEDLARAITKTMTVTLDRLSIESTPPEIPSFTLEIFTSRGDEVVQKVLSLEVRGPGQVWTKEQLPVFHIDCRQADALKVRALAAPGLVAAEKSFDFTRYLEMDIREDAPVVLTYPFGSEGDFCVAINATLGSPLSGPGIFALRPGRFETGAMPQDSQELWGPAPLPELTPGISNLCTYATHALVNHWGQTTLTARVVHSVALMQSVVQIRAGGKLSVLGHLIGLEQIPLPSQVDDPKVVSFDPKRGERAMLIRNSAGDWGICVGCWVPPRKDTSGEPAAGNFTVRFFHLPTSSWHNVTFDYESGNYRMTLGKVEADLKSGQVTVGSGGSEELAEYMALTFCVAMLHVLCQPRPPNWEPGATYYSGHRARAPPTRDMLFPLAAGCDVATPSNQFLSIKFGRSTGNSGSMHMHGHHQS